MRQGDNVAFSPTDKISKDLTIPKLFYSQAKKYGKERVAMREKEYGIWRPITWNDYFE
ncbi:MAG: long-chain acyl-CoA synthetase, partial [Thermodesulfobacteriota bacterium]|nr:long-chain acyl-CoA synthetase [Thermodesulfobacteriota bacterium]